MRNPFEPHGDQAQWRTVYEHLAGMQVGDTIKYTELEGLLPGAAEVSLRGAFYRAVKEMEDEHLRTFDCVRGVGYRMVEAREHERLARRKHKRARRQLAGAHRKAHSADRSQLNPEERKRLDALEDHLAKQQDMIRRLDARVAKTEEKADKTEARTARAEKDHLQLADRVDQLAALLARHGIADGESGTA